ncbi:endoplasmic reticulum mannosyl-oligosaccharide 1,2-alpha-mannosidase [Trichonephila clavipes]|nr:endoplasmic reticulum mannosyl-oligosaccharide 1,2-alpha-mannosidase [Trichonephila clavipes]
MAPNVGPRVSEISTAQLEFRVVSLLTSDPKYENAAIKVFQHLHQLPNKDGLFPMFINAESGQLSSTSTIKIGARADSYHEYLLKQWIQTGRTINWLKEDYMEAVDGILKHLGQQSFLSKLTFVGELLMGVVTVQKWTILPGALALGFHYGLPFVIVFELMATCYDMYAQTATRLLTLTCNLMERVILG